MLSICRPSPGRLAGVIAIATLSGAVLVLPGTASAAPTAQSTTFTYTGADQTFAVPAGVTELSVTLWGGAGGAAEDNSNALGGSGGKATFTLSTAGLGSSLKVRVGGNGESVRTPAFDGGTGATGGWNGGAAGGNGELGSGQPGAGGGGSSTILTGSTLLGAAGGGGGAGGRNVHPMMQGAGGAGGDTVGGDPHAADGHQAEMVFEFDPLDGGGGGTSTAGGAGAVGVFSGTTGVDGAAGIGGAGATVANSFHTAGGGGGGGGYYGGGGGATSMESSGSGGGGGSSWIHADATNPAFAASDLTVGQITISWTGPSVPAPPTGLAASTSSGALGFSWVAPTDDGGTAITGYTVTLTPGGGTCTVTTLSCTITGLSNATAYAATATATNVVGASAASSPVSATPVGAPSAPRDITSTVTNAGLLVTWSAPASNGGSPITGYHVTATLQTDSSGAVVAAGTCDTAASVLECTIADLTSGSYTVQVLATNVLGSSGNAQIVGTVPTTVAPATTPTATAPEAQPDELARTGSSSALWLASLGALLVLGGVTLTRRGRRLGEV
jgi:LPXTG-motif cell wall-anchored protein